MNLEELRQLKQKLVNDWLDNKISSRQLNFSILFINIVVPEIEKNKEGNI